MVAIAITRADLKAAELRTAAARSRDAQAARRMLALVLEGVDRKAAAERQWVLYHPSIQANRSRRASSFVA